jgi:hypothetical protein
MNVLDYEYDRRVGFALSFADSKGQTKLLKLYAVMAVLAMVTGIALGFAI